MGHEISCLVLNLKGNADAVELPGHLADRCPNPETVRRERF